MKFSVSKIIWAAVFVGIFILTAMFLLPVIGAILLAVFALSALLWLSGKVVGFFQPAAEDFSESPLDSYEAGSSSAQPKRYIPRNWNKLDVEDAEIVDSSSKSKEN